MSYHVPGARGESLTGLGALTSARAQEVQQTVDRIVDRAMQFSTGQRQRYLRGVLDQIRPGLSAWAKARAEVLERHGYYARTAVRQAIAEGLSQHFGMSGMGFAFLAPVVAAVAPAVIDAGADFVKGKLGGKKKSAPPPRPPPAPPLEPKSRRHWYSGPALPIAGGAVALGLIAFLVLRKKRPATQANRGRRRRRR